MPEQAKTSKSQVFSFRLPSNILARLDEQATANGLTRADMVRWVVDEALSGTEPGRVNGRNMQAVYMSALLADKVDAAAAAMGQSRQTWVQELLASEVGYGVDAHGFPRATRRSRRAVSNGAVGEPGNRSPIPVVHESELVFHSNPEGLIADMAAGRTRVVPSGDAFGPAYSLGGAGLGAIQGLPDLPVDEGRAVTNCRHPRWRRLAGLCLRCGSEVR